jgi:hypothetical protein
MLLCAAVPNAMIWLQSWRRSLHPIVHRIHLRRVSICTRDACNRAETACKVYLTSLTMKPTFQGKRTFLLCQGVMSENHACRNAGMVTFYTGHPATARGKHSTRMVRCSVSLKCYHLATKCLRTNYIHQVFPEMPTVTQLVTYSLAFYRTQVLTF